MLREYIHDREPGKRDTERERQTIDRETMRTIK